jgi:hypothetical protein
LDRLERFLPGLSKNKLPQKFCIFFQEILLDYEEGDNIQENPLLMTLLYVIALSFMVIELVPTS